MDNGTTDDNAMKDDAMKNDAMEDAPDNAMEDAPVWRRHEGQRRAMEALVTAMAPGGRRRRDG